MKLERFFFLNSFPCCAEVSYKRSFLDIFFRVRVEAYMPLREHQMAKRSSIVQQALRNLGSLQLVF